MKMLYRSMEDRLSELPDSLILVILSLMPKEDAVRTTILSKRWKDLWTRIPYLDFQVKDPVVRTRVFLHEFLQRWKGVCIRNLDISFSSGRNFDLDSWVRFASEKKVENLWIDLPFRWCKPSETPPEIHERLPRCVYSCSSIKKLSIRGCNLEVQERVLVQWDNLTSLYIDAVCLSEDVINQVVSSAPRLESFELRLLSSHHNLKIESSSLKMLSLTKYNVYKHFHDPTVYAVLTIRAPNLESLHLWGNAYRHCDLQMDAECLSSVTLCFYEKRCAELQHTLLQILPIFPHVEQVTLSPCAFKMLGLMQAKYSFPVSFPNVKKMMLDGGPVTPKDMAGLTQMFPQVETLLIHWKLDVWYPFFLKYLSSTTYKDSEAKPCLNQLRTVEIILYSNYDSSQFRSMLRLLRDHATEPVTVRKGETGLKMMLDELKAMCKLKRLHPDTWHRLLTASAVGGVFSFILSLAEL